MTFFWWLVIIVAAGLALWYAYSRTPVMRRAPGGEARRGATEGGAAGTPRPDSGDLASGTATGAGGPPVTGPPGNEDPTAGRS